jgi:2-polyprenyl-6-methoxyphenol hydroxylase-like FAD-dependent oxidoreductase
MNNTRIGDRAVVVGASMAGLLAAHVLANSYGQVIVIDRDQLPERSMHRRGVPHGRHLHALAGAGAAGPGGAVSRSHRGTGRRRGVGR